MAGRGTFVTKPLIDMQMRLSAYTEEMERRGKKPESKTLLARRESAGPGVARALEIEENGPIAHWQRLRLADSVPMAIQHVYLSWRSLSELPRRGAADEPLLRFAMRDLMQTWGEDSVLAGDHHPEEEAYWSTSCRCCTYNLPRVLPEERLVDHRLPRRPLHPLGTRC